MENEQNGTLKEGSVYVVMGLCYRDTSVCRKWCIACEMKQNRSRRMIPIPAHSGNVGGNKVITRSGG